MKREFLKSIEGLTDDAIDKIMAEVGKDVAKEQAKTEQVAEKSKQELENLQSELKTTKETLDQANVQIENFKGMDVEGTKKAAEEWKTKYETFEANSKTEKEAYEKKLQEQSYDFAVKEMLGKHKFSSDFARNAFANEFKNQGLKLDGQGDFLGADDYIKLFTEKNPGVFVTEEAQKEEPQLPTWTVPAGGGQPAPKGDGMNFNFTAIHDRPKN